PGETERREPGGAVIISYEDGCADTIRPRLEAAGADLRRVAIFDLNEAPTIPNDLTSVEDAIRAVGARLLIVDPLMASISDGTDSEIPDGRRVSEGPQRSADRDRENRVGRYLDTQRRCHRRS